MIIFSFVKGKKINVENIRKEMCLICLWNKCNTKKNDNNNYNKLN